MSKYLEYLKYKYSKLSTNELLWIVKNELFHKNVTRDIIYYELTKRNEKIPTIDEISEKEVLFETFEIDEEIEFNKISIRGRFAYCMKCLEKSISKFGINNEYLAKLVNLMWKFVSSNQLDEWEETILDEFPEEDDFWEFSKKFCFEEISLELQEFISKLIINTIEVGRSNLYSGYNSDISMLYLKRVIYLMKLRYIDLPNINDYKRLKADIKDSTKDFGWGRPVKLDFFKT